MKIRIQTTIELSEHDEAALRLYWEEMRDEGETFRDWYKSSFVNCGHCWFEEKIADYGRFVDQDRRITCARIIKAIGCKHLTLEKVSLAATGSGSGNYFVFFYDTHPHLFRENYPEGAVYGSHSIYVQQLNHMDFDKWVEHGKDFVRDMEGET